MSNIETYREKIDAIDKEVIRLMSQRFEITQKVGEFKAQNNLPAKDESREKKQYLKITQLAQEYNLDEQLAKTIMKTIIDAVVENHKKIARAS